MLSEALTIFIAQYCMIFMLGLQSQSVNRGYKMLAAITSVLLGVAGFKVTGIIAQAYQDGMFSMIWWAFIIAGPMGIVTSMYVHPIIGRWLSKK